MTIQDWYNKYCAKHCVANMQVADIANLAAKLSYRASVLRALYENDICVGFKKKYNEKTKARCSGEKTIEQFLKTAYSNNVSLNDVEAMWNKIRDIYHQQGIFWYTYGNAQKWLGMSIKYFFIIAYIKGWVTTFNHPIADCVFPIDSIIMKEIKKDPSVNVDRIFPSWSKCDDKDKLKKYIEDVKGKLNGQKKLLEYEIEMW